MRGELDPERVAWLGVLIGAIVGSWVIVIALVLAARRAVFGS